MMKDKYGKNGETSKEALTNQPLEEILKNGPIRRGRFRISKIPPSPKVTNDANNVSKEEEKKTKDNELMIYKKGRFGVAQEFDTKSMDELLEKGVTLGLGRFKVTKPPRKESTGTPSKEATRKDTEGKESFTAAEKKLLESGKDITKGRFTIRAIPPEVQNPQITENKEERTPSPNGVASSFSEPSSPKVIKQESAKSFMTDNDIMNLINQGNHFAAPITTKADYKEKAAEILDIFDKTSQASSRNVAESSGISPRGLNRSPDGGPIRR